MQIRQNIEALIPEVPREIVKRFLRKAFYPDYGLTLNSCKLTTYSVKNGKPAIWSADSNKPHGALMTGFSFPQFLLARAMIRTCDTHSWCDLGTGSATLPFQTARLGVTDVFAIEGSDAPLRQGKVQFPLSNYCVADITLPLEVIGENGAPAYFDVVSCLEVVEHIPDSKLEGLFDNIRRMQPKFAIFAVGLQPDHPYHVNLKSMLDWLREISLMLSGWVYDDILSTKIFRSTRCHTRFINRYSNHLSLGRNLIIFVRK